MKAIFYNFACGRRYSQCKQTMCHGVYARLRQFFFS